MLDPINIGGEEYVALCEVEALDNSRLEEITQLKARVMELEEAMGYVLGAWDYDGVSDEHGAIRMEAETRLNRTPAKSLEAHDREVAARALEKASVDLPQRYDDEDGDDTWLIEPDHLLARAAKLRTGGE